jgi:tetratricopeptide (TPR) repeat protein
VIGKSGPSALRRFTSLLLLLAASLALARSDQSPFEVALQKGSDALASGDLKLAREQLERALERDPRSPAVWKLRAQVAAKAGDVDEQVFSLHRFLGLRIAQKAKAPELEALKQELMAVDPLAVDLLGLKTAFVERLRPLAEEYEKEKRPHSAIRVHQQLLALDPEREESHAAIERLSAAHDPSLADTARAKDLLEGISEQWIKDFDAGHGTWEAPGLLEKTNYKTRTDAGYVVMVRAAEAMEQMNGFYREFFHYGGPDDSKNVPRIELHIFKTRDEYLKLGAGPPAEWSGGQFTGGAVETYIGQGGFEECITTLFHEAAHQFVGLATSASGWLNEGLASFFEGSRLLANGTVQMNLPANHRLFPLAQRMAVGWMDGPDDGIAAGSTKEPDKAPTFRIVLENKYQWGPPWYAPTWGVVYFLWNYQDPVDGRFVYRGAFREFINKSGGRAGEGAVENFEKVVLLSPQPPTKGIDFSKADPPIKLPKTVEELDVVWKEWMLALRDEQSGKSFPDRPWLDWARAALTRKDFEVAKEQFEKGLVATPDQVDLLLEFGKLLASPRYKNNDRATKLGLRAAQLVERASKVDDAKLKEVDHFLASVDPKRATLDKIQKQLEAAAKGLAERYLAAQRPMMAMEISWRLGTELDMPALFDVFERAAKGSGRSLALWKLAYNEKNLDGWIAGTTAFLASGVELASKFGDARTDKYDYEFLTCDTITSGDYSFEAELLAENEILSFAGLVFGKKASSTFHSLFYFPGRKADPDYGIQARNAAVDLTTFYGTDVYKIWRHNLLPVTRAGWHKLRIDVVGTTVDVWSDDELVVSQDFGSLDALRGSFGLITGPGQAKWRNVRYLARNARDPGAAIEREVTMQKLREAAAKSGKPIGASYVGLLPPFPDQVKWLQQPRKSFDEAGTSPQLLVFFSLLQNGKLPLEGWLADVASKNADLGLKVISIASPDDEAALPDWLAHRRLPGSVGVDQRVRGKQSYGIAFERYFIPQFQLPRVLLLDVDQRVVWEGTPGLEFGKEWQPGTGSYLDAPLAELLAKRHLRDVKLWLLKWDGPDGEAAFKHGDVAAALPFLKEVEPWAGVLEPKVVELQQRVKIVRAAVGGLDATAQQLARVQAEAALPALVKWAELFGTPADEDQRKRIRKLLDAPHAKAWLKVCDQAKALKKTVAGKDGLKAVTPLLAEIDKAPGPFAPLLKAQIEPLLAAGDAAGLAKLFEAPEVAAAERWLAAEFFHW